MAEELASRLLITGLELSDRPEPALNEEYFAPVLGVAEVPEQAPRT